MNLYIQVENGQCVNHPAFEDNLIEAFGQIPSNWEPFDRIEQPATGIYEVCDPEQPVYQKVNGRWKDVWSVRPMTQAEKDAVQKAVKDAWNNRPQALNWSAWTYDEEKNSFIPPIPRPDPIEGKTVFWSGTDNNWKEAPAYPQDGKNYDFDFFAWSWVEKTI
jgi:hypothetical protein